MASMRVGCTWTTARRALAPGEAPWHAARLAAPQRAPGGRVYTLPLSGSGRRLWCPAPRTQLQVSPPCDSAACCSHGCRHASAPPCVTKPANKPSWISDLKCRRFTFPYLRGSQQPTAASSRYKHVLLQQYGRKSCTAGMSHGHLH